MVHYLLSKLSQASFVYGRGHPLAGALGAGLGQSFLNPSTTLPASLKPTPSPGYMPCLEAQQHKQAFQPQTLAALPAAPH